MSLPDQPAWSDAVELLEYGREFSKVVGRVKPIDDPPVAVELVQVEYIDFLTQPAVVRREAAHLRMDGYRYDAAQAADLARLIQAALGLRGEGAETGSGMTG